MFLPHQPACIRRVDTQHWSTFLEDTKLFLSINNKTLKVIQIQRTSEDSQPSCGICGIKTLPRFLSYSVNGAESIKKRCPVHTVLIKASFCHIQCESFPLRLPAYKYSNSVKPPTFLLLHWSSFFSPELKKGWELAKNLLKSVSLRLFERHAVIIIHVKWRKKPLISHLQASSPATSAGMYTSRGIPYKTPLQKCNVRSKYIVDIHKPQLCLPVAPLVWCL